MTIITTSVPSWSDNISVQAPYAIIKGEKVRATLDLRTKVGARLFWALGFGGSTDLTAGVDILIRPILNNDAAGTNMFAAESYSYKTGTDPYIRLINNGSNYAVGASSFAYDGHAGKTAAVGEKQFFWGAIAIPVASGLITPSASGGCEVLRCSSGITTPLLTDKACSFLHLDNEYIGLAESANVWLPGGALYEIICDYGASVGGAGEAVAFMARAQTYDSDVSTT